VNVQVFALFIEPQYKPAGSLRRVLQLADFLFAEIEKTAAEALVVTSVSELEKVVAEGKLAVVMSIEGGEALEGDLGVLRMLYRLGVRALGLTWNQRNQIADGVGELKAGGGITSFGEKVVIEMNRLGMLVDLAHITPKGFYDVLDISAKPVIVSHGNCRSICDHPRNLDDEQIKALAKREGVLGLTFCPSFVDQNAEAQTLERLVDHAVHAASLVGAEHLGIGSDFDGITKGVKGLEDVSKYGSLTEALLERGFSAQEVEGVLGRNFLRVFRQVWQ